MTHPARVRGVIGAASLFLTVLGVFVAYALWVNIPERPDLRIPIAISALVVAVAMTIWRPMAQVPARLLLAFVATLGAIVVWAFLERSA